MESDESEGIQDLPVTFELNLPDDMNTDEVISLMEVLQSDIEGFDEMLLDAVFHEAESEAEQTESKTTIALKTEKQIQQHSNAFQISASNEQPPGPSDIFLESSGCRFKTLAEQDLQEIECNKYSNSTKKNTKWGIGVFNGEYFTRMI